MKSTIIALFLIFPLIALAGKKPVRYPENSWSKEELEMANTAKNTPYLSQEEKDIILYMNLVRMDGTRFFNTYLQDFIADYNQRMQQYSNYNELKITKNDRYYKSLQADLKKIKNLGLFYPDETLTYVSLQHAKDMNNHNLAGHNSYDGRTMKDRITKYYPNRSMAENLAFGFSNGLANVCVLLIDKGVPDLGHRKNILNSTYGLNIVGISIRQHPRYKYAAVIDFVGIPNLKI
ncbi:CAP domain-containing protein [Pedobacter sp.]|jgi:uncharacterized protein YkwD|uniref:CAP domain-containing protein n=1 Tax=Pedobacter sp. TaxID=1411316 RepID=UPI002BB78A59|nr:CAP domain-containing protein [Pedobacter sp.]HWW42727.1 CAP domain-containing protein [Pedobacter sp.]